MIQITNITPLNTNKTQLLQSLNAQYFKVIEKLNHVPFLLEAIDSKRLNSIKLSNKKIECLKYICINYPTIVLGKPHELQRVVNFFYRKRWNEEISDGKKNTEFGIALIKLFGYSDKFRSVKSRGIWLASQLNIKVCPYCNSQYTLVVNRKNKGILAKFQFDHFFPLKTFPYLSVSLYNIIPSCASCNHKKSNRYLVLKNSYHPYHNSLAALAKFKINFPVDLNNLLVPKILSVDIDKIKVVFKSKHKKHKKMISDYDELFDISSSYERHKDIAQTIIVQSVLHNQYYQNGVMSIDGLFPDKKTMLKYILGSSIDTKHTLDKPLSKFTQDLAHSLKLI